MNAQTAFLVLVTIVLMVVLVSRIRPASQGGDPAITAAVSTAISKEFPFSNIQIDVKTFDGVVILGGFTRELEQAKRVVEITYSIDGVKSVDNRIMIRSGQ